MDAKNVGQYMISQALVIHSGTSLKVAIDSLFEHKTTGAAIINADNHVIGFLSERDCIQQLLLAAYHQDNMPIVDEVMTTEVTCLSPEESILDVAEIMTKSAPKIYPVTFQDTYVGIITRQNILKALLDSVDGD